MAEVKGITVPVTPEIQLPILASSAPVAAQIVETPLPHKRFAVAVTEEHGLQATVIEFDPQDINPAPYRAHGIRTVTDVESFLNELARRPLDDDTGTLWGSSARGVLTAIYNDHGGTSDGSDAAGWRDDRLELDLQTDPDWAAWHAISGVYHGQEVFGDKIEDLLHTITDPDQAELLEVIDSVRASTSGEFNSQIERANGGQKLVYNVSHDVRAGRSGQLEVPQTVTLLLRPWENHPNYYEVGAYFRVRVNDGKLSLAIKLKPTRQTVREAWIDLTTEITEAVDKPVHAVK